MKVPHHGHLLDRIPGSEHAVPVSCVAPPKSICQCEELIARLKRWIDENKPALFPRWQQCPKGFPSGTLMNFDLGVAVKLSAQSHCILPMQFASGQSIFLTHHRPDQCRRSRIETK